MTTINQKEYLKKYLAIGKAPGEKKKKKKKDKAAGNRLKIIDDDVDVLMSKEIENDIATANEDAPQIVAVIDERPHSMQIDEKTNSSLWKPLGGPSNIEIDSQNLKLNSFKFGKQVKQSDISKYSSRNKKNSEGTKVKQQDYSDHYPKKNDREKSSSYGKQDVSPPRKRQEEDYSYRIIIEDDDHSPPRKSVREESSSSRKKDRDYSPPGKKVDDNSPPRKRNEDDSSPPRKRNKEDSSPPRRRNKEEDISPRRRNKDNDNSPLRKRNEDDSSPPRKRNKEDSSPPRRRNKEEDISPRRRNKDNYNSPLRKKNEEDSSPPRKRNNEDNSPPRKRKNDNLGEKRIEKDNFSPERRKFKDDRTRSERELSPSNKHKRRTESGKKTRWGRPDSPEASSGEKMKKTLDGKRAGLQNAKDLSKESKYIRQKEDELFKNMSTEVSGRNAATVIRGNKVKDPEEEAAKAKREKEMKEKYDRWGKGLKQVEDQSKIIEDQLHEMSKPLARYADDEDLERFLKEQERDGDPMLNYIRKKKRKEKVAAGIPEKPMYMGEFMPNRFGICPGYRWDGVDRSNGYEKKWFEVQNAKKADREEAFKWSTEDM